MNKKNFLFLIAMAIFTNMQVKAQSNNANELVQAEAAKKALSFVSLIPEGREKSYGFDSRADFSKIKVEEPYQTYYVANKNNVLSLVQGNEWRVPLSVDGKYITMLTVQMNNGAAKVVDMGGATLAQKLQAFEQQYPDVKSNPIIIRNTFLTQDFLTLHFNKFCNVQPAAGDYLTINTQATDPLYQINEGAPIETSVSSFCNSTMQAIKKLHLDTK